MRINDNLSKPVTIVGGGLAGLNAARLLHRSGVDFLLFEARDRPGGRILTVDEAGQPSDDGFDLGPSWFWPAMQPAIGKLVAGDVAFERMSRETPHRLQGKRTCLPPNRQFHAVSDQAHASHTSTELQAIGWRLPRKSPGRI